MLYTLGGLENLQTAKKYYASTIDLTSGKNTRALFGVCLVSTKPPFLSLFACVCRQVGKYVLPHGMGWDGNPIDVSTMFCAPSINLRDVPWFFYFCLGLVEIISQWTGSVILKSKVGWQGQRVQI